MVETASVPVSYTHLIDGNQFLARRHIDASFIHPFAFPAQLLSLIHISEEQELHEQQLVHARHRSRDPVCKPDQRRNRLCRTGLLVPPGESHLGSLP